MTWEEGLKWLAQIIVVAVTAGLAVWRAVMAGLDSKIQGMEGRLAGRLDSVGDNLDHIKDRLDRMSSRVHENSEKVAVLDDRWKQRRSGPDRCE